MKSSIVPHVQECTSVYFMCMCVSLCMLKEHIVTYHVRGMSYSLQNIFMSFYGVGLHVIQNNPQ